MSVVGCCIITLAERIEAYDGWDKIVSYQIQQDNLPELKKEYPMYKRVPSKVLQMTLRMLDSDFKSFYSRWISNLQSRREHCKKYSRKWYKIDEVINRLQKKLFNQLKDFQPKLSRKIVNNTRANTIIVGDLAVKNMGKSNNKGLNRSTQNTGFLSRFVEFLTYKAEQIGKRIIRIDEAYTSKTCCNCGKIHKMPLYQRNMKCDCGNKIDRDQNSAINIMIRFLSQNAKWTGYQTFVDNLRQTVPSLDGALAGNPTR